MTLFRHSLFIFTRDLRLTDNAALIDAARHSECVHCIFIVDPVFNKNVKTRSYARQFLYSALHSLAKQLDEVGGTLTLLSGSYRDVVTNYIINNSIECVFVNHEYTLYGIGREAALTAVAKQLDIQIRYSHSHLLLPPGIIFTGEAKPYKIFTPFYNKAKQLPVERIQRLPKDSQFASDISLLSFQQLAELWQITAQKIDIRRLRIRVLKNLSGLSDYNQVRDYPAKDATSKLSAHLKFGTISVREAYWAIADTFGFDSPLLRQFYWRDFFSHIGYFYSHVFTRAFHAQFANIAWSNNTTQFQRWCDGNTGFPIVDAGMRELNQTGYMHNRVRMIVASFLVKDLHIDWRWGEQYFADKLIDYDVAVNNGNWQWAASTGCDAQPYFRIFNPWLQQKKFDPDCEYIFRWIPELQGFSVKDIHHWYKYQQIAQYPQPMLDHHQSSAIAKSLFAEAASANR